VKGITEYYKKYTFAFEQAAKLGFEKKTKGGMNVGGKNKSVSESPVQ